MRKKEGRCWGRMGMKEGRRESVRRRLPKEIESEVSMFRFVSLNCYLSNKMD